jgi:translocation and assembly module TamA
LDASLLRAALASKSSACRTALVGLFCLLGDFDFAEIKEFLADSAQVETDARRIETVYEAWGYPGARATGRILPQRDGDVVIEFTIEEGEPIRIRSLELRGLEALLPSLDLPDPLPLAEGDPYALPRLEDTQRVIARELAMLGYATPAFDVTGDVDRAARAADLVLHVEPGPLARFGPVTIEAASPLDEALVRAAVAYRPGDPFRPSALERTERRLYDLPIIERAAIRVRPVTRGDTEIETTIVAEPRALNGFDAEGTNS